MCVVQDVYVSIHLTKPKHFEPLSGLKRVSIKAIPGKQDHPRVHVTKSVQLFPPRRVASISYFCKPSAPCNPILYN